MRGCKTRTWGFTCVSPQTAEIGGVAFGALEDRSTPCPTLAKNAAHRQGSSCPVHYFFWLFLPHLRHQGSRCDWEMGVLRPPPFIFCFFRLAKITGFSSQNHHGAHSLCVFPTGDYLRETPSSSSGHTGPTRPTARCPPLCPASTKPHRRRWADLPSSFGSCQNAASPYLFPGDSLSCLQWRRS